MRTNGQPEVIEGEFDEENANGSGSTALATVRGGVGMIQTRTQYSTAVNVQRPRVLTKPNAQGVELAGSVLHSVLREAGIAGEDFIYSMTFKSKDGPSVVEGVSIDGAMILARNYMNCACECDVVEEGPSHWIFKAVFIDHETGFTEARLFRQNKGASQMRGDPERKLDIAFQIGQSKAKRNVIVRAMPTWLVTRAVDAAKDSAAAKVKDLPKAIEGVTATFLKEYEVGAPRLEKYIGAPSPQWNARDIVRLRSLYKALKDRQTTIANEFPVEEAPPAAAKEAGAEAPPPSAADAPKTEAPKAEAQPTTPATAEAGKPKAEEKKEEKKAEAKKEEKPKAPAVEVDPVTGEVVPPPREPGEEG